MEDIELHDAARVKVVVTMRVKLMLRRWLLFQKLESIVIIYLISIMMHTTWKQIYTTSTISVRFWYTKIKAYAKTEHWERNYLISNWTSEKENKYSGICFLTDKKTLCIHGTCVGSM